jgi:hypothetical protein
VHCANYALEISNPIAEFGLYQIWMYNHYPKHRYLTFCTPECAQAIDAYLNYPQKFLSLHYNRSITHPENDEDFALVEAEQIYEKMLENGTNRIVTNLSDNISAVSTFAQAFHPNFDTIDNNTNNTTKALCDN